MSAAQLRRAEYFVDWPLARKGTAKNGGLSHSHRAHDIVGVLLKQRAELRDAQPRAANATNGQMRLDTAMFFAVAEFGQRRLDAVM